MSYRSQLRIIADILRVARDHCDDDGTVKVSVILRKANLSYSRLSSLLEELIKKGLLQAEERERGQAYRLTKKGMDFLTEYEKFERFARGYGLRL